MGAKKSNGEHCAPKKYFGIEFAPTDIPLERRLQTLSVILWVSTFLFWNGISYPVITFTFGFLLFFEWYKLFAIFSAVIIPYFIWMFRYDMETPHRGSRPLGLIRGLPIWKYFNDYFPIKLVKTAELDPSKNYLFCSHPHGLICFGVTGCFAHDRNDTQKQFPGFQFSILTFDTSFIFPFSRELLQAMGFCTASRRSMNYMLGQPGGGKISILIPGGAPESLDFNPGSYVLQLKKRKGFIKVALQNGTDLVPVFSFGENRAYSQVSNTLFRKVQEIGLKLLSFPPVMFYGRGIFQYTFGFLPKRQPITVVVGTPIPVRKFSEPTAEQITELHEKYVNALANLFYDYKDKYSTDPNDTLVIT